MLRSPSWWLRRLAAMSPPEVAQRLVRTVRYPLDRAALRLGLVPPRRRDLAGWSGPARSLSIADLGDAAAEALAAAERICRGEREVLGLGWLDLGDEPWHREPLAGAEWPLVDAALVRARAPKHFDPRLTWELNRGHEWVLLAQAEVATGDRRFRARLDAELKSWRRTNPIGVGINWVSSMEAAVRIHSLSLISMLLQGSDLEHIGTMIHEHAWFVARNLSGFSSANNHLIVELSSLVMAGRMLGGPWHSSARSKLEHELTRQVYADGVDAEMSTHYHAFVMEATLLAARIERASGAPSAALEDQLSRMATYLAAVSCESGELLTQGDCDDGKLLPFLRNARALLVEIERFVAEPRRPLQSRLFRDAGQVVFRWGTLAATFDAGPFGFGTLAAHAHCDALAVNVAMGGRPFLVDRGTYVYNGDDAKRDAFRLTGAHNTLQIEAREQGVPSGPFLWRRVPDVRLEYCDVGDELEAAMAVHDGFAPARHRRTVLHRRGLLVIVDEILDELVEGTVRFHFAPDVRIELHGSRSLVARRNDHFAGELRCSQAMQVTQTHHAPAYRATVDAMTASAFTADRCLITAISESRDPTDDLRYIAEHANGLTNAAIEQLRSLVA